MGTTRGIDAIARLCFPRLLPFALVTRIVGYHLTCALLMSQTATSRARDAASPHPFAHRELGSDAKSPGWVNALEDAGHRRRVGARA
jgi:hypothetical protein